MYSISEKKVGGYQEQPVSSRIIQHDEGSDGLAIILPGLGYSSEMPLLYYVTSVLVDYGYDVLQVNYHYDQKDSFKELNQEERDEWLYADVDSCIKDALQDSSYNDYVLVGKSLGTRAMAQELTLRQEFAEAKAIWLTPLLNEDKVRDTLLQIPQKSLVFIGEEDPHYLENPWRELEARDHIITYLMAGANHAGNVPRDTVGSIQGIQQLIQHIEEFLKT